MWFTSANDGVRVRHLQQRPAVSATNLPGPEFAMWMHGTAALFAPSDPVSDPVKQAMINHRLPIQGPGFIDWVEHLDACAVRIDPSTIIAFRDVDSS